MIVYYTTPLTSKSALLLCAYWACNNVGICYPSIYNRSHKRDKLLNVI